MSDTVAQQVAALSALVSSKDYPDTVWRCARSAGDNQPGCRRRGLIYMARARLLQNYIEVDGRKSPLAPGLSAMAEIKTGDRSIISYLLSPLARRVQEAGRER
jgi:hemolysin D